MRGARTSGRLGQKGNQSGRETYFGIALNVRGGLVSPRRPTVRVFVHIAAVLSMRGALQMASCSVSARM